MLRVSVDIGGTFTDMVITAPDGTVEMFKSPSTHGALSDGVLNFLCIQSRLSKYLESFSGPSEAPNEPCNERN